ncbi:MAG: hypothetical protein RIK85_10665, partial [Marinobacter sp.]
VAAQRFNQARDQMIESIYGAVTISAIHCPKPTVVLSFLASTIVTTGDSISNVNGSNCTAESVNPPGKVMVSYHLIGLFLTFQE